MFGFKHGHAVASKACSHTKAIPRWDRIEETGDLEHISQWYCPECDRFIAAADHAATERPVLP